MPNPTGKNQYNVPEYPSDATLCDALTGYAREKNGAGLSTNEQLARLKAEFGVSIGRSTFFELKKRLKIPTVRKNPAPPQDRAQAVLQVKESDVTGQWGVGQTRQRVANTGVLISRRELREILHDHFDEEFDRRGRVARQGIPRTPLSCIGPWHQVHSDGHEKLNSQALGMGVVTLPIYGFKDQFSSYVIKLQVVPDVRSVEVIGHLFLDIIEEEKCAPLQLVMDKGSEIGDMVRAQRHIRAVIAPEFSEEEWPSTVQVPSKRNTPIESFWHWQRKGEGLNIKQVILSGKANGIFNPNCDLHVKLFNWLWPSLVQARLDKFREYWNSHRISSQAKKHLPSGTSPRQMWIAPESTRAEARKCAIYVDQSVVQQLRNGLGGQEGRARTLSFVDPEFQACADAALGELSYPEITLLNAWSVFQAVYNTMVHL